MAANFCPNCGFKLTPNARFCANCGASVPLIDSDALLPETAVEYEELPPSSTAATTELTVRSEGNTTPLPVQTFSFCGRELSFAPAVIEYCGLMNSFSDDCRQIKAAFSKFYNQNVHCFDDLYEQALPSYMQSVAKLYRYTTIVLEQRGVTISDDALLDYVSQRYDAANTLSFYTDLSDQLSDALSKIASYRAANRSTQYTWGSVGFGLKGAIKGAVTASALNMGTQFIRGVTHNIVDASDRAKFERIKERLFREGKHEERMTNDLIMLSGVLFAATCQILISQGCMEPCTINSVSARYDGQCALSKAKQFSADVSSEEKEEVIELACRAIQADPQTTDAYLALYWAVDQKADVTRLAQFLKIESTYLAAKDDMLLDIAHSIDDENSSTPDAVQNKINRLESLLTGDPDRDSRVHRQIDNLIQEYHKEKQRQINELERKKQEAAKAAEEEALRQAALAAEQAKAAVWTERLEKDKAEMRSTVQLVNNSMSRNDISTVWKLVSNHSVYAEYTLHEYYTSLIDPVIDAVNVEKFNQIASSIRGYANQGLLFAKFLLSFCNMLFWLDAIQDEEKAEKMMQNCAKAAERGCISAIATVGALMEGESPSDFLPMLSRTPEEMIRIAAENQHPAAMWQYGTDCKKSAGSDLEQKAKADYFITMSKFYGFVPPEPTKKSSSSSGCFITSAVCCTLGKPDDCYELTTFRSFRDDWLAAQPDGQALIQEYYRIAPGIVTKIDCQSDSSQIYLSIWKKFLIPCLHYIEEKQFSACKDTYMAMVDELKSQYA